MPTYEYVCEKCDHEFELFQSIKVDALETCTDRFLLSYDGDLRTEQIAYMLVHPIFQ